MSLQTRTSPPVRKPNVLLLALVLIGIGYVSSLSEAQTRTPSSFGPQDEGTVPVKDRTEDPPPFKSTSKPGGPPPLSPDRLPSGISREEMWPAPTAEDWKKPCLIQWQRSWEDAKAVSRETGKPILICVNMDGEIASEHYAGIRYRDPEIAKLYEPYVCVIASVYRHNPRDYDEEGNRIPCPRFGTVTCGEHIAIEPLLYKDYFDGQRIAPRHIAVETDGSETYDIFYAWDTDSVFGTLRDDVARRPDAPRIIVRGDRPLVERVASRDITDRLAVEAAFRKGDPALRRSLLEAAIAHPEAEPIELLRQAVFGFDVELSRMARTALARSREESSYKLIAEALRVPMEAQERDALVGALNRIGESSPRARMLAVVHQGLAQHSEVIDAGAWLEALEAAPAPSAPDREILEARITGQAEIFQSGDAGKLIELAEAFLFLALERRDAEPDYAGYLFQDARRTALEARRQGATGWRVHAAVALADYHRGQKEAAHALAEAAVTGMPPGETAWNAAAALGLFAEARWKAIASAVKDLRDWETWSRAFQGTGTWLTDVHAVYTVLERHPFGSDEHFAAHYDFLKLLEAPGRAGRVLDEGLERFPDSIDLHARLRGRILREKGVRGLGSVYDELLARDGASPHLRWFAAYASSVAAEFHRRRSRDDQALAAYDRAIALYERWIEEYPDDRAGADHYVALALAGRARVALERGDLDAALEQLLAALARKPDAAATRDGLNISPVDTAWMLLQRLDAAERAEDAAKLRAALDRLDPELLELPAYEGGGDRPDPGRERRRPGRNRRPRRDG